MKQLLILAFATFILLPSCGQKGIRGNGNVKKETRNVSSDFESVSVSGAFRVQIKEGNNSGKVVVEADENLLQHIVVEVKNDDLKIRFKTGKWGKKFKALNVYITAKDLEGLALSGSGYIKQEGENDVNTFKVAVSGSGEVESGANASTVKLALSGSGDISMHGKTDLVKVSVSGSGDISTKKLKAKDAEVAISGSADVHVYASDELKARISGSGDVTVHGNPDKIDSKTSGSGGVTQA